MDVPDRELAAREHTYRAALRDLVAGVVLLAVNFATHRSVLAGGHRGVDYAFDGLAVVWIAWAIGRLVWPFVRRSGRTGR